MSTKFIKLPDDYKVNGYGAQLKVKAVKCGKAGCTKCPHGSYAYLVYRVSGQSGRSKTKEFYIGQIKAKDSKEPINQLVNPAD
ncbi:MAG: hypothetical protein ABSH12_05050 [Endomicrobiales bacterium]